MKIFRATQQYTMFIQYIAGQQIYMIFIRWTEDCWVIALTCPYEIIVCELVYTFKYFLYLPNAVCVY